jgi:hypothetical protein
MTSADARGVIPSTTSVAIDRVLQRRRRANQCVTSYFERTGESHRRDPVQQVSHSAESRRLGDTRLGDWPACLGMRHAPPGTSGSVRQAVVSTGARMAAMSRRQETDGGQRSARHSPMSHIQPVAHQEDHCRSLHLALGRRRWQPTRSSSSDMRHVVCDASMRRRSSSITSCAAAGFRCPSRAFTHSSFVRRIALFWTSVRRAAVVFPVPGSPTVGTVLVAPRTPLKPERTPMITDLPSCWPRTGRPTCRDPSSTTPDPPAPGPSPSSTSPRRC